MRADAKKSVQITDLVDTDLLACRPTFDWVAVISTRAAWFDREGIRLQDPKVGVVALFEPRTRGTDSASRVRALGRLAQEPVREAPGQMGLPESRTSVDQERVRQFLAAFHQARP
jgi:hypothetical protein